MFCQSVSNLCFTLFWQKVLHNFGESLSSKVNLHCMEFSHWSMARLSLAGQSRAAQSNSSVRVLKKKWKSPEPLELTCQDLSVIGDFLSNLCGICGFCFVKLRTGSHASMQMILQEPQQSICKKLHREDKSKDLKALKGSWMVKIFQSQNTCITLWYAYWS